ncbi:glycosyltransferase [Desulforhopalus sp. 52FAK]
MLIVTDLLKDPIDEGAKVTAYNLVEAINRLRCCEVISLCGKHDIDLINRHYNTNKLFLNFYLLRYLNKAPHTNILYIPEASLTTFTLLRTMILRIFTSKEIFVLALQPRKYGFFARNLCKIFTPKCTFTPLSKNSLYLSSFGIRNKILPLGVDITKFYEFSDKRKQTIRSLFNISMEKIVLLHVGHIQDSRNLDWFVSIKNEQPDLEIIVVGSTYNKDDEHVLEKLDSVGVKVIKEYISNIAELYNLADYYVFPVMRSDGAIGTPLSVIEAMSCNLPIITTQFGSLPDTFEEDDWFHYTDSPLKIIKILEKIPSGKCNNREKVISHSWPHIAKQLLGYIED